MDDNNRQTVLVIDDTEMNLILAQKLIESIGKKVIVKSSGEEVEQLLGSSDIGLIFIDHMMPDPDGYTVTRKIRTMENKLLAQTPIIGLTGDADPESIEKGLKAGMNEVMNKPFLRTTVEQLIEKYLPRSENHSDAAE